MKQNRLKTIFVATIIAALLVIIITVCIIFIPSRPCVKIEPIQNLTTIQINNTLLATWSEPRGHGDCPMTYRIQLSRGAELIEEGFSMIPRFFFLNVSLAPCSPNTISVHAVTSPRFGGDVVGDTSSFTHFGNIGPVTNLQVLQENNALTASWDPPTQSELCTLSYEVKLEAREGEPQITLDNTFTFDQINSRTCEVNKVIVTPLGAEDSLRGQEKTRAHLELGPVEDLELTRGGLTLLTGWEAPNQSENCQLSYEVTLTFQGEVIEQVVTQFDYYNFYIEDIRACSLSNVTVTPIATVEEEEVRGLEIHRVHIEGLGPVVNIEITQQTNGLLVGWDPPSASDFCSNFFYEAVLQTRDGTVQERHFTLENQILLKRAQLEPCVTNIVILTPMASISDGETVVIGQAFNRRHFGDVGPVENLVVTQDGDGLVVNWTPPVVNEECPMFYIVNMWYNEDDITRALTDKLTYVFENAGLKPCIRSEVSVTPVVNKHLYESVGEEARVRYFGDIGSVANFELTLNDDNQLVAKWNAPVESELCELSYEMLLESSEEITSKVFAQNYFEHVIIGADLRPCAIINVTLTPIAVVEFDVKRGLQETRSYFAGVGPAENLEVSQGEEGLLVEWMRPAQSELCQISYEVTLSFGDVVLDRIQTDVEGHTFVEANLESCVENRVSVIPIGRNQGQETEGPEARRDHFADLGPVINFEVTQQSNGLHASWSAPKNSDFCIELSYEVVLISGDEPVGDPQVILENELLLEDANLEPCAISTVEVNPSAKTSEGEMVTGQKVTGLHLADVGPVENLVVVQVEEGLTVHWAPPMVIEDCPLTYEVNLLYGGEVVETGVTDLFEQVFESVDLRPCVVSEVSVTPLVDPYERRGEETRERHIGEIGSVTNFELTLNDNNQLTARWNAPIATEQCELSYEVLIKSGEIVVRQVFNQGLFEHVFTDANVRPCVLHSVTLTPVAMVGGDSVRGVVDLQTYSTGLGPVANLEVNQQPNGLLAVWDPPGESEACIDVSYEVVLKTDDETILESQVVLENEYNFEEANLEPCVVNVITVTPTAKISDGETSVTGEGVIGLHVADIGPVENLVVVKAEENLVVNWEPPTVSANCDLMYEVNLWYNEEVIETTMTDNLEHVFENADVLRPCMAIEISVTPLVDLYERRGQEIRVRHVGEIGSVTNFELTLDDSNQLTARWNAPINSDLCEMSYEIVLDPSDPETRQIFNGDRLEHVFSEANLRPCILNTVTLTPIAIVEGNSVRGAEDHRTYFTGLGPIVNLEVTRQPNSLLARWNPPGESESCVDVSYEVVLKTYDEIVLENLVVVTNEYNFEEVNLEPCSVNIVAVTPMAKISDGETIVRGEDATNLHFADIGPVENLVLSQTEEGLAVNWVPPTVIENCPLTYEIKLLRNDEIIETDVTDASEYIFENAVQTPCLVTEVSITPLVDLYERRGEEKKDRHVGEIGAVTNFELTFDDSDQLTARWNAPIDSELCDMSYEILLDSGDPEGPQIFNEDGLEYVFSEANLRPCILNTMTLTPIANVEGDSVRGVEDLRTYFTGLGPIANFEVTQQPNGLLASWDPPSESESCIDVSYEVVLKTYDEIVLENLVVLTNEYNFEKANLEPCSLNIVVVTPIAKISDGETAVRGEDVTSVHFTDIGPVENLVLAQTEEGLAVNWAPPTVTENCPLTYEIKLLRNDEIIETDVTDASEYVYLNAVQTPCLVTEVSVTPLVDLYERRGEEKRDRHVGEIGSVTNFELTLDDSDQLTARWNAPIDSELCDLTYEILLDSGDPEGPQIFNEEDLEYVFSEANLRPCILNTVTLTPIANVEGDSVRGVEDLRTYFTGLGPVANFEVTQQPNGLLASWDPPSESESCIDVSYEVVLKTYDEIVLENLVVLTNEYNFEEANLEPCSLNIVVVTPIAKISDGETAVRGEDVTNVHFTDIGPVENLALAQTEEGLSVNWAAPTVTENCPLTYEIKLLRNDEIIETDVTDASEYVYLNAVQTPCLVTEISVTPLVDLYERRGEEKRNRHVGEIGSVTNFELTLDDSAQLTARWNAPIDSELCDISYEILLDSGDPEDPQIFNEDGLEYVFSEANLRPCILNTVILTPIANVKGDSVRGVEDLQTYFTGLGPVANFEVTQQPNGLLASWDPPGESESCIDVSYEVVLKTYDEIVLENLVVLTNEYNFEEANLEPCSLNIVVVTPMAKISDGETAVRGEDVTSVHFTDIGPVENLVLAQTEDGLAVNWAPPTVTENCPLTYEIKLLRNDEIIETDVTDASEYVFENAVQTPCLVTEVSVTPLVDLYERRGEEKRDRHVGEIGSVTNFELTLDDSAQLTARWNAPIDSELCDMSYEILLDSGDPEGPQIFNEDGLEYVFSEANLRPCILNTVTLTPIANVKGDSVRGVEDLQKYFTGLGPVANFEVTQQPNGLLASWDPPDESESCIDVSYEVVLKTYDEIVLENLVVLTNEYNFEEANLEPCSLNIVVVTPMAKISDGETAVRGEDVTNVHFTDIGPVENLVLTQTEEGLAVNWAPPTVTESCPLAYEVNLLHNNEIIEADVTDASAHVFESADLTPCLVIEVSVTPLVDLYERRGEELRERHVGEIGSVINFEVTLNDYNQLTARWNAPIATESCDLSYEVLLDSDEGATRLVFDNRYFEYVFADANIRPCVLNTVTLTPIADVQGDSVRGVENLRTYFTGLGPVANLEVTQQPNGLLANWDPPDSSEFCIDVSYEVVLKTDDEVVLENRVVVESEFNFEEADLQPCALSIITITPTAKVTDGETIVIGEGVTKVHIADIGSVQNLVLGQAGEGLAVNWEAPTVSENCPLTYEVSLWYNEDVAETTTTDNLGHVFENADVRPCAVTEVSVIPAARKDSQETKGEETRGRHIGEISSITNFELITSDLDNLLVARWNAPVESELCELSYEILLESSEGEPPQIFTANQFEHVFSEVVPRSCISYTVTVTPVAILEGDPMRGLQDTLTHVEDIGPVEDLKVNESGESLLVTWARPVRSELCQVSYEVTLRFGEEVLGNVQTDVEEHIFVEASLRPCTENHVSVIPIGRNQELTTQGPETNQRYFTAVGPVQNLILQAEPFGISWTEPVDSDACVLSYHVQVDSVNSIVIENFYPLEDIPCHQYAATVTPLVQEGLSGPPLTENHQVPSVTEIGPVQSLRFSENAFEWDPPMNTGECEVTYELTVTSNGESTVLTTKERIYEVSSLCSTTAIVVVASVEEITSEPAGLETEVPPLNLGPVENLEFRSDRVRWQKPSGSGACPFVYKLTHTSGSETREVTLPESQTYFLIDLKFCSRHKVSVYVYYEGEGIAGDSISVEKTIDLPSDPAAIGRVKGLTLVSEVQVEWQPPDSIDAESCNVVYSVTLDRGFDMKTVSQAETHFEIPEVPCSNNVLSVFPIVNGVLGQVADISSVLTENAMVDIAPVLISFTTGSTSVSSIWRAFSIEINACKITNFTVELVLDGPRRFVLPVTDNEQRIISVEVNELLPDTEYTMRTGIHIHEFPMHGPLSEAFEFRTEPLRSEAETKDFIKLARETREDSSASVNKGATSNEDASDVPTSR